MTKSAKRRPAARKPHGQTRALKNFAPKAAPQVEQDKLASAKAQGQAQFDSIKEMVAELADTNDEDNGLLVCNDERRGAAEKTIQEDALSVQVRSGWYSPGADQADTNPAEYEILLCTGGPACRIVGDLDEYGQPETAQLEVQDWFQPWTEMRPLVAPGNYDSEPVLLAFARCFYFVEG